jgi:holo-[acyl-carrier protein] synthase
MPDRLDNRAGAAESSSRSRGRRVPAMILGIGSDLANIERIERTIARFGARFLDRVYAPTEQALAERRRERVATYAKRWAAKEACSKALGTGLRMGIKWRDMGVVNLHTGQPTMLLTGWAEDRLRAMTPPGHRAAVHLTLTDDHPWAMAVVVIEGLPES